VSAVEEVFRAKPSFFFPFLTANQRFDSTSLRLKILEIFVVLPVFHSKRRGVLSSYKFRFMGSFHASLYNFSFGMSAMKGGADILPRIGIGKHHADKAIPCGNSARVCRRGQGFTPYLPQWQATWT
jgi:hypothetical protein